MIGRIFDNLEVLMGEHDDLLQARQALAGLKKGLGDGYMEIEPLVHWRIDGV